MGSGGDSFVTSKHIRSSGGIVLQIDDNQFHIDPGTGAVGRAAELGVNLRATTTIFTTHNHLRHCGEVNAVIDAMTYGGFDKKGVLVGSESVIKGSETFLHPTYKEFLERNIVLKPGQRVGINEIEIQALKTKHSDESSIGLKFFSKDFTISYSSDTKFFPELVEEYKNSNILILNVPHLKKEDAEDELCIDDAVKLIKGVKPRLALLTHFGTKIVENDPLYLIREVQKETGIQTISVKDGMVINPVSYAAGFGQKTLQTFSDSPGKVEVKEDSKENLGV